MKEGIMKKDIFFPEKQQGKGLLVVMTWKKLRPRLRVQIPHKTITYYKVP